MSKKSKIFANLFGKSKTQKLETDSVPIPDNESVNQLVAERSDSNLSSIPSMFLQQQSISSIPSPGSDIVPMESQLADSAAATTSVNNNLALNHTQGYNVYQFSQINGLHIGSVYTINANSQSDRRPKQGEPIRKTKTIDAMMKSTDPLVYRTMDVVSTHLGQGWRDVARHLKFSDGQIEQMFEENHPKGIKEVIYQFLLDYSRNDDDACLGHLSRILWKNGNKETVYILKEYWKNGELQEPQVSSKDKKEDDEGNDNVRKNIANKLA